MSILSYCFSEQGLSHKKSNVPCQDSSIVGEIETSWYIIAVADGVGSCKHSDEASKLAVNAVKSLIERGFPYNGTEEDMLALIRTAMHWAENAIENYVISKNGDMKDYHTTLAVALYDGIQVFYGNVGDSGIIALDEYGEYHILTKKQNNEFGEVTPLYAREFEIGKADFDVAAVLCMTDGLLDWVVPKSLEKWKYPVHVKRANLLVEPRFWDKSKKPLEISKYKELVISELSELVKQMAENKDNEEYGNLFEGNLKDDLSAAVLINPDDDNLSPEEIKFELPPQPSVEESYTKKWCEIKSLYPEKEYAEKKFVQYVKENNPEMSDEDIAEYVRRIINGKSKTDIKFEKASEAEKCVAEKKDVKSPKEENLTSETKKPIKQKDIGEFIVGVLDKLTIFGNDDKEGEKK